MPRGGKGPHREWRSTPRPFLPNPTQADAEARFRMCAEAYETLGDADRRADYDRRWRYGRLGANVAALDPAAFARQQVELRAR